ncbi:aquaporin-1-like [Arachis ipaensis]|uniref:Aquaporin n=1 Tax=Arachis hypogaea TaxID=3818 RepID=A0A444Y4S1_ARAHY|nr:aquaporin-1-like [Arachis ipaensis]RYQ96856.1 hypothetical protein Ahy_B08g092756 [Arachis hypogaea]
MEEEGKGKVGKGKGIRRRCSSMSTLADPGGWTSCATRYSLFLLLLLAWSPVIAAPRRSPLFSIRFAIFLVYLTTIPITGTRINPARSLGVAIIFNRDHAWNDQWILWVGHFIRAALATVYHQIILGKEGKGKEIRVDFEEEGKGEWYFNPKDDLKLS